MAPKVGAHVVVYTLMFGGTTLAAIGFSKTFSKSQGELDAELRAKYPELIKRSQDQKVHMQAFFDKMKDRDSTSLDKDFAAIMKGGNGDIKRTQMYDKVKEVETAASTVEVSKETPNFESGKPDETAINKTLMKTTVEAKASPKI